MRKNQWSDVEKLLNNGELNGFLSNSEANKLLAALVKEFPKVMVK